MDLATPAIATTNLLFHTDETIALRFRSVSIIVNFQFFHGSMSPGNRSRLRRLQWSVYDIAAVGFIFGMNACVHDITLIKARESHNPLNRSIVMATLIESSSPEENVLLFFRVPREFRSFEFFPSYVVLQFLLNAYPSVITLLILLSYRVQMYNET